jgi:hypothetical protein
MLALNSFLYTPYAIHDSFVQGLSYVASMLLLQLGEPQATFEALANIILVKR